jgi:SSS family solute:Na+ symporter
MLTLMSAAMSTLSSQYHVVGTSIGRDLFEKSLGIKGYTLTITRIGVVISILASALLAYIGNQLHLDIA